MINNKKVFFYSTDHALRTFSFLSDLESFNLRHWATCSNNFIPTQANFSAKQLYLGTYWYSLYPCMNTNTKSHKHTGKANANKLHVTQWQQKVRRGSPAVTGADRMSCFCQRWSIKVCYFSLWFCWNCAMNCTYMMFVCLKDHFTCKESHSLW